MTFNGARLTAGAISFDDTVFNGADVSFRQAELIGGALTFSNAKHLAGSVTFFGTAFNGTETHLGPFEPTSASMPA